MRLRIKRTRTVSLLDNGTRLGMQISAHTNYIMKRPSDYKFLVPTWLLPAGLEVTRRSADFLTAHYASNDSETFGLANGELASD